jgi:hypothetical protein
MEGGLPNQSIPKLGASTITRKKQEMRLRETNGEDVSIPLSTTKRRNCSKDFTRLLPRF